MLRRLKDVNLALLILRVGMGGMMLTHGIPKLMRGPDLWPRLGSAVEHVGITEGHTFFGAAAVLAETLGALFVILGFKTRPAAFAVFMTMAVAAVMHFSKDDGWSKVSHPIEVGLAFLAIAIAGAGKYSVDRD